MKVFKEKPKSILFVCLGNICRSPTAEEVFRKNFKACNIHLELDSAGTAGYHQGEFSDPRTIAIGKSRGYELKHRARKVLQEDFEKFDLIFAMDNSNLENLKQICPEMFLHKLIKITDFSSNKSTRSVPDPYYGTEKDFHLVVDILEDCFNEFYKKFSQ